MAGALLLLAVILAGLTTSTPVRVRDGPLIEPTASPTTTPSPTAGIPAAQVRRPTATSQPTAAPTPTTWPMSPAVGVVGQDMVDLYRIENSWRCGGDVHDCMMAEDDALVLARIALAEAPSSVNDQIAVMWLIRLRAELGYKNRKYSQGWCGDRWCYIPGVWGDPTSIKTEALCVEGCQFSPAQYAQHVYFPCGLADTNHMRLALCPTDDQLGAFAVAYAAAQVVLAAPLSEFPAELRGFDSFRSPSVAGEGQRNRVDGLRSVKLWPGGNIWRDELLDDNIFWGMVEATPTPKPVLQPTSSGARLGEEH